MTPDMWQLVAGIAVVLLVIGLAVWYVFGRSRRSHGFSAEDVRQLRTEQQALREDLESQREKVNLLTDRVDRYDRTQSELREEVAALSEEREVHRQRSESTEKTYKALQEQIYELREELKVLMQREDRHDRKMNELQEQASLSSRETRRNDEA